MERGKYCSTPAIELERQLYRADAEVATLRAMVRALAFALALVPGKGTQEEKLVRDANLLAGSAPGS